VTFLRLHGLSLPDFEHIRGVQIVSPAYHRLLRLRHSAAISASRVYAFFATDYSPVHFLDKMPRCASSSRVNDNGTHSRWLRTSSGVSPNGTAQSPSFMAANAESTTRFRWHAGSSASRWIACCWIMPMRETGGSRTGRWSAEVQGCVWSFTAPCWMKTAGTWPSRLSRLGYRPGLSTMKRAGQGGYDRTQSICHTLLGVAVTFFGQREAPPQMKRTSIVSNATGLHRALEAAPGGSGLTDNWSVLKPGRESPMPSRSELQAAPSASGGR
jgi:hypothetical protein